MLPLTIADPMSAPGSKESAKERPRYRSFLGCPATTAVVALLWVLLSFLGYYAFTRDQTHNGSWGCEMAYMYPSYHRVEWPGYDKERYSVYLYREGGVDPGAPMGLPVIFLPGNAGHFKQVRSIASSASMMFFGDNPQKPKDGWHKPLDFFTLDYNEDFSAFHAPTLEDQARFVATAAPHILEMYQGSDKPTRIILLGHSMGGIVARLASLHMDNSTIEAIVTMSTPHAVPPVAFESKMDTLYNRINAASHSSPFPLLVSICGGVSDTQILSESCALPSSLIRPEDGFAVYSTDIPGAWTGVEHQAMVWCDQVRWRVARALLDMADAKSREDKLASARKWLLSRPVQSSLPTSSPAVWHSKSIKVLEPNMSVIVELPTRTETTLVEPPIRVRHCENSLCEEPKWSLYAIPNPPKTTDPFPFPGEGIRASQSRIVVDVFDLPVRGVIRIEMPRDSQIVSGTHDSVNVHGSSWYAEPGTSPVHVELLYERPVSSLLAWKVRTEIGSCDGVPPVLHHEASPSAGYGSSYEARFYPNTDAPVTLHSHISGAPFHGSQQQTYGVKVHLYQQPGCTFKRVTISLDVLSTIAKAMLRFRITAVTWCMGWIAIFLLHQLVEFQASGTMPSLSVVIERSMRKNVAVVGIALAAAPIVQQILGLFFSKEQFFFGSTELLHVPFALMIAFWSLGLVIVVYRLQAIALTAYSWFWRRSGRDSDQQSTQWVAVSRLITSAILLLIVKLFIPWRMAFVVLYIIQFFLVARSARDEQPSRHQLLASTLLLMTFLLPLTVPAIAVWGRNLWMNHGHPFASDHAILPLVPVLLLVQSSSVDRTLSRHTLSIKLSQIAAALLAITAFTISSRKPYYLITAADLLFLALSAVLTPFKTS